MRFRPRILSKPLMFGALMALAATLSVLPSAWTARVRGLVQVLGVPQAGVSSAVQSAKDAIRPAGEPAPSALETRRLQEDNAELRRLLAAQDAWLADLEQRLEQVSQIRSQLGDSDAQILVAPVLGYGSSALRDTLLIGRGAAANVRRGQWVAAGVPPERRSPDETGQQLLMRQWLIGRVSEVDPRQSRVLLVSDPKFEREFQEGVCVARVLADGRWQPTPLNYALSGQGRGRMMIHQADADYKRLGYELVLAPASADLPVSLSIGRIVSSTPTEESALHFDLVVEPWRDPRELRQVYVIIVNP
jgi:cell shape-determining protein MreC